MHRLMRMIVVILLYFKKNIKRNEVNITYTMPNVTYKFHDMHFCYKSFCWFTNHIPLLHVHFMMFIKLMFYMPKSNVIGHPSSHHQTQTIILRCPLHFWLILYNSPPLVLPTPWKFDEHMLTDSSVLKLYNQFPIDPPLQKILSQQTLYINARPITLCHLRTLTYGLQVSLPHTFVHPSLYYY
jgi:hypothetical protein